MFREECEDLAYEIAFWMEGLSDPDLSLDELAALGRNVSGLLRSLAIMVLLSRGKVDRFQHNLVRSGRVRLAYLERVVRDGALEAHDCVAGVLEPLLDAIAAGDLELARRVADLAPRTHRAGHEYEDDFCYAQALRCLLHGGQEDGQVAPLMARMAACCGPRGDARIAVCEALAASDQAAFELAFAALLESRSRQIDADIERGELAEAPVLAQRTVYVEGLAVLRLADARGLTTDADYLYCPGLARGPMLQPCPTP